MGNKLSLVAAIGVPLVSGFLSGMSTRKDVQGWYKRLRRPWWNPPDRLFGPVWSALYCMMGTASWLVWKDGGSKRTVALALYGTQLALNLLWTQLFFKFKKIPLALADMVAMLGFATAATVTMSQATSPNVILPLMVPYLVWVSYATALTAKIMVDNPNAEELADDKEAKDKLLP